MPDRAPSTGIGSLSTGKFGGRAWPIPKRHRIWWKDGNRKNCAIENLELLNAKSTWRDYDPQPGPISGGPEAGIMMAGALKRKIRQRTEQAIQEALA